MKVVISGFGCTKIDINTVWGTAVLGDYMHTKFSGMYSVSIILLKIYIYVQCNASTQGSTLNRNKIYLFSKPSDHLWGSPSLLFNWYKPRSLSQATGT